MFLHGPGRLAIRDHFVAKAFIKSQDKPTDEVTFLSEVGFGLKDKERSDILFQRLFTLIETFETGESI